MSSCFEQETVCGWRHNSTAGNIETSLDPLRPDQLQKNEYKFFFRFVCACYELD